MCIKLEIRWGLRWCFGSEKIKHSMMNNWVEQYYTNKGGQVKPDGPKAMTWPDGGRYRGEGRDAMGNDIGTMTWADGTKYVGAFKNGRYHGHGTLTLPDGTTSVGEFKDGKFVGK